MARFVGKTAAQYAADANVSPDMIGGVGRTAEEAQAWTTGLGLMTMQLRLTIDAMRQLWSNITGAGESMERAATNLESNAQQRAAAGVAE